MRKKVVQLPRGYLSYSQIALWQGDPKRYAHIYFDNRDWMRVSNAGMEYGKEVAEALENEETTGDLLTDAAMLLIPKYDIRDKEIRTELKTRHGAIPLLGRPDMMDSATKSFYEIKTGKTKWTQKKAQDHFQIMFYAMMIYNIHKVVPPRVSLVWVETEDTQEGVKPTGRVEEFVINISLSDILHAMALTTKVALEIQNAHASHARDTKYDW